MTTKCTKRRYRDGVAAKFALAQITAHGEARAKTPQRAYPCPTCKGWHLTSSPRVTR